jgi:hypothetical protein
VVAWNLARSKEQKNWQLPGMVTCVALAADGRHVACLLNNGTVAILRLSPPPDPARRPVAGI